MGIRRESREFAMQTLFYMDFIKSTSKEVFNFFCSNFEPPEEIITFAKELVEGVLKSKEEIDLLMKSFSEHWKISRMSCVDRNVIRISIYEIVFRNDIPPRVSINEAIEIGKKYGTKESGSFINGVLDGINVALSKGEIKKSNLNNIKKCEYKFINIKED